MDVVRLAALIAVLTVQTAALRLSQEKSQTSVSSSVHASATASATSRRDRRLNHFYTEVEPDPTSKEEPEEEVPQTPVVWDATFIDKSVRPQDDLYQYATGGWQKKSCASNWVSFMERVQ